MATEMNKINVRLQQKTDTFKGWTDANPTPLYGELCVVIVPAAAGAVTQEPTILFKVGDGTTPFNSLNFTGAIAADVHDWAKEEKKPTYEASEITGISTYIAEYVESEMGISVDTDTQYTMVKVSDTQYKLMSKDKSDVEFTKEVGVIDIPEYDDTALTERVSAVEALIGTKAVATQIAEAIAALDLANTYEAKGTAATEAGKVQDELNAYKESNDAAVEGISGRLSDEADRATAKENELADSISAMKDGESLDSFKDVEDALAEKQPVGDYATKSEAQNYANAKDEAIAEAKKAGDDAQADVDALAEKVGTVTEGKTIVEMIEDAKTEATYDDTEVRGMISENTSKIDTLVGEDTGKSARTIANEELAKQLIPENAAEARNSLEEIAAWIQSHPDDASAMNAAIVALQGKVDTGDKTVSAYVTDAINALNIGDYAKAADLLELAGRVSTLETEITKKTNDADLAPIAKSGNVADLVQTTGTYIIFNCGSATEVI